MMGKKDAELRAALADPKAETRWAASMAAGNDGAQGVRDDLMLVLSDGDPLVRQAARRALVVLANREMIVRAQRLKAAVPSKQVTDFGPTPRAGVPGQLAAAKAWKEWFAERDADTTPVREMRHEDSESVRLAKSIAATAEDDLVPALEKLRDGPGDVNTAALVDAIGRLKGNPKRLAREALVGRFTKLGVAQLQERLADSEPEVRRAAALATVAKDNRALVPDLIKLLADKELAVATCAHIALKSVAEVDFGPTPGAIEVDRKKAVIAWKNWLSRQK